MMDKILDSVGARTTADMVFEHLYDEIAALKLLPGARLSEAEVASRFQVSRQPVRDAFNRLANLDLLLIRPQRATRVRGFSMEQIANARFVRLAVELEVITRGAEIWEDAHAEALSALLQDQEAALQAGQTDRFHAKDYVFHKLICELSGFPLAFETIETCKRAVDRLCVLSLQKSHEVTAVLDDHRAITQALAARSPQDARAAVRHHLGRLDDTIQHIHATHAEYFE